MALGTLASMLNFPHGSSWGSHPGPRPALCLVGNLPPAVLSLPLSRSLVGPRPSPFRENQICVPWRRARLSVRPGITGLWQVCRHNRDQGDFHQWIAYDISYVRNMSLKLDFKILLVTVITLGGRWYLPEAWLLGKRRSR